MWSWRSRAPGAADRDDTVRQNTCDPGGVCSGLGWILSCIDSIDAPLVEQLKKSDLPKARAARQATPRTAPLQFNAQPQSGPLPRVLCPPLPNTPRRSAPAPPQAQAMVNGSLCQCHRECAQCRTPEIPFEASIISYKQRAGGRGADRDRERSATSKFSRRPWSHFCTCFCRRPMRVAAGGADAIR